MIVFCPKNSGIALYLLPRLALTAIVHPKLCLRSSTTMIYCSALNIKAGNERRRSRHFQLILLLARPSLVIIFDRLLYFKKKYVCFAELWYASCSSISDKSFAVVWNLTWCHQIIQDENVKDYNFDKKNKQICNEKCAEMRMCHIDVYVLLCAHIYADIFPLCASLCGQTFSVDVRMRRRCRRSLSWGSAARRRKDCLNSDWSLPSDPRPRGHTPPCSQARNRSPRDAPSLPPSHSRGENTVAQLMMI